MPILQVELMKLARVRLRDSEVLFREGRYDSVVYLCGYVVELVLKARICRTLRWSGYPATKAEFRAYASFRTHDLEVLLHLSSRENVVNTRYLAAWSLVRDWDPESRYSSIGTFSRSEAQDMINGSTILLGALCR